MQAKARHPKASEFPRGETDGSLSLCAASQHVPAARFRYIRLERARDHDHPEGDSKTAYIIIAPLDADSRIDVERWREHKDACRVVRKRPDGADNFGHLVPGAGGNWRFHYDVTRTTPDESGYHFGDERFEPGEYLSIREADGMIPYRVVSVLPL